MQFAGTRHSGAEGKGARNRVESDRAHDCHRVSRVLVDCYTEVMVGKKLCALGPATERASDQ